MGTVAWKLLEYNFLWGKKLEIDKKRAEVLFHTIVCSVGFGTSTTNKIARCVPPYILATIVEKYSALRQYNTIPYPSHFLVRPCSITSNDR